MTWCVDRQMNNTREYVPDDGGDSLIPIKEWEECCANGMFIDYDGFGYFVNLDNVTELYGFDVYPSMIGSAAYEQRKVNWTHINWFNR